MPYFESTYNTLCQRINTNSSWTDAKCTVNPPKYMDIWTYPFLFTTIILFLRYRILEKIIFTPIASYLGIPEEIGYPSTPTLENLYHKFGISPPRETLIATAKKLDCTESELRLWLRQRSHSDKVSKHSKFLDGAWKLTYYTAMTLYGLKTLMGKPWFIRQELLLDYPDHKLENDVWWYYMISLSYYWAWNIMHLLEPKRKDLWQMLFHHFLAIFLLCLSWSYNLIRMGCLVLLIHDIPNTLLYASKVLFYLQKKSSCHVMFLIYAVIWVIAHDGLYPWWIIYPAVFEGLKLAQFYALLTAIALPVYYIFSLMLIMLQLLHLYWTPKILKLAVNSFAKERKEVTLF